MTFLSWTCLPVLYKVLIYPGCICLEPGLVLSTVLNTEKHFWSLIEYLIKDAIHLKVQRFRDNSVWLENFKQDSPKNIWGEISPVLPLISLSWSHHSGLGPVLASVMSIWNSFGIRRFAQTRIPPHLQPPCGGAGHRVERKLCILGQLPTWGHWGESPGVEGLVAVWASDKVHATVTVFLHTLETASLALRPGLRSLISCSCCYRGCCDPSSRLFLTLHTRLVSFILVLMGQLTRLSLGPGTCQQWKKDVCPGLCLCFRIC